MGLTVNRVNSRRLTFPPRDDLELLQDLDRLVLGLQEDGGNVQKGKGHGPPYSMSSHISGRSVINLSSLHDSFIVRYTVLLVHLLHVPSATLKSTLVSL